MQEHSDFAEANAIKEVYGPSKDLSIIQKSRREGKYHVHFPTGTYQQKIVVTKLTKAKPTPVLQGEES